MNNNPPPQMGLRCSVFINSQQLNQFNTRPRLRWSEVVLVGPGIPELCEVNETRPAVVMVKRMVCGSEYKHIELVNKQLEKCYMAGGTFIFSHDSRFPSNYPLSFHDRTE